MPTLITAADVHRRLEELYAERAAATLEGLTFNPTYSADLEAEIYATRAAYVGAAVTELATLQGELSGRNQG